MKTEKQPNRSIKAKHQEDVLSISETKPSEVTDSFWVYAKEKKGDIQNQRLEAENGLYSLI